jgi:hypothetical protein
MRREKSRRKERNGALGKRNYNLNVSEYVYATKNLFTLNVYRLFNSAQLISQSLALLVQ